MAGPTCTLMLADMGAEVIKVEKVPHGDDTRRNIPPKVGTEAAAFLMMNRNKRGAVVDLKTPGGVAVLEAPRGLGRRAGREFRAGRDGAPRLRLRGPPRDNPGLIYCSLSGFGRTGPTGTAAASISSLRP
jgi:crotonobetainyl-CoA:carnitine CoA-transferase CaiB-like acyl-CoA transferase